MNKMTASEQNTASQSSPTFKVIVNGNAIPQEYNLVSMMIIHEVNRLSTAKLVFLDGEASKNDFPLSNKPEFLPGATVKIEAGYNGENEDVFQGIVIRQSVKLNNNKSSFLWVECRHKAVMMTKVRKSKIFLEQKDSDIFGTIAGPHQVTLENDDTTVEYPEMVQFNCSDWDFLISRAEANGFLVWGEGEKLMVKKPSLSGEGVMELKFGVNLLEFDAELDGRWQFESVKAYGWDPSTHEPLESESSFSDTLGQGNASSGDLAGKTGDKACTITHGGAINDSELRVWADAQQLKFALSRIRGRAKCKGASTLKPGKLVTLAGMGDRFNGKAFLSGVRHEINQGNWHTDVAFGLSPKSFIREHDVNENPASGLLPGVNGLQIGIVSQLEKDPLGEDRVMVKIPMTDKDADGVWARQALLDAGKERGSFFRPEIGDEVILGFLNDDPRHPVILGMLNSSKLPAVTQAKDTNHFKGFVTREKMKIWFDDENKTLEISTDAGNSIRLDEKDKKIALKDQHGNEITMSKDGIVIKSIKDIKLDAASGKIGASGNEIESSANSKLKLSGNGSAEMSSGGTTSVKGSMVQIN